MRVLSLGDRLALVVVFVSFVVGHSVELYQFPPPPPMKPGWGSLPEVDLPQVVGLKVGHIGYQPALFCCTYRLKVLGSRNQAHRG